MVAYFTETTLCSSASCEAFELPKYFLSGSTEPYYYNVRLRGVPWLFTVSVHFYPFLGPSPVSYSPTSEMFRPLPALLRPCTLLSFVAPWLGLYGLETYSSTLQTLLAYYPDTRNPSFQTGWEIADLFTVTPWLEVPNLEKVFRSTI